ncbi:CsgG/HfaB family protein [Zhongshania aliphaticivorans]|uniref:CsgG/HfaB family protein n=1 Tax=Zhongshania aliphaticivorans TaxID=1470434 RepID=UPI00132FF976|nr:CsgG/HfaB family protein [Zhongshania aliphaticivorans]
MKRIFMAMKLLGVIFAVCLLLPVSLHAQPTGTRQVEVEASGFGGTQDEAIRAGLASAVSQVNGTSLQADQVTASSNVVGAVSNKDGVTEDVDVTLSASISARTQTSGNIHSYDVLSLTKIESGYEAKLMVRVYRYDTSASSARKRMALLQTKAKNSKYFVFRNYSGSELAGLMTTAMEQELVQTRKFAVLSRDNLAEIGAELNLISSDATSREEKAKLGRMLGADFLLLPEIVSATGSTQSKTIKITGQTETWSAGSIVVSVKVIAVATGEVKYAEQYSSSTSSENSRGLVANVAKKAVTDIVEKIYPKQIIKVSSSGVIINAGGRSVSVGQRYNVFLPGEVLFDPYTGESLGSEETFVGAIAVSKVLPKMSHATKVSGGGFEPGMIIRPTSTPIAKSKAPVQPKQPVSGVALPFD